MILSRRRLVGPVILAAVSWSGGKLHAQGNALQDLEWLVGPTWRAETPNGPGGTVAYEVKYAWAPHQRLLIYHMDRVMPETRLPGTSGVVYWDPVRERLENTEVDSDGSVTRGTVAVDSGTVMIDEIRRGSDGSLHRIRTRLVPNGRDAFAFTALMHRSGKWERVLEWTFRRTRDGGR